MKNLILKSIKSVRKIFFDPPAGGEKFSLRSNNKGNIRVNLSYLFLCLGIVLVLVLIYQFNRTVKIISPVAKNPYWKVRSIDTMKYSRDPSREKLHDTSFDLVIAQQVKNIAKTGASHIAIATPYDEEFLPIMQKWVNAARENHLKIWFRGNFSGWEGWFEYPKITADEHQKKVDAFILNNSGLFEDGDIFTACPECENGGPGDPRQTGDVEGYRSFLIDEYKLTKEAFQKIGKRVASNYDSMNMDVARKVMDRATTLALDNVVVVDHYVASPQQLSDDLTNLALVTGGKVVLGEFGAPIPDIHGNMTDAQQAEWISNVLKLLSVNKNVIGVNYWVSTGGSTELWSSDGVGRSAVSIITSYYSFK